MTENSNKGNKNWQLEDEKGASAFGGGNSRTQKFGGDHERSNNIHNEREALLRNNAERPGRNNRRKSTSADPPHHSRRRGQITNRRSRSNTSQRANETRGLRGGRGRQNSRGGPTKFNDWTESNRQGQSGNNKRIGGKYSSHVSRDGDKKSEDAYDDDKEDFERKLKPKYNDSSSFHSGFNAENAFGGKKNGDKNPETYDPEQREIFPFRIFIKDMYLTEGIASRNETDDIIKKTGIKSISLDN